MKQLIITIILLTCGALVTGCARKSHAEEIGKQKDEKIAVKVVAIGVDTFVEYGTYYGRISPLNEAKLICYSGGRVEALRAAEGTWVKKGSSLASIDSAKAKILLETAKLQESIALKNLTQTKKHLKDGNASQLAVDQAHLAYLGAKSQRIDAQKNYRGALAITPLSGIVTFRSISLYQELSPGYPTFSVAQISTMKISIAIIESDAPYVLPGSEVTLTTALHPEKKWSGTINTIAREASSSDRTFKAEIYIGNKDGVLKAGATGIVRLALRVHENAVVIPTDAIRTDGVQHSVMVALENGKVQRRIIEAGPQSDTKTLVKSGLYVGDRLIIKGHQLVSDGMTVRIAGK